MSLTETVIEGTLKPDGTLASSYLRLVVAVFVCIAIGPSWASPLDRTDAVGDPLPDYAFARLGSARFRLDEEPRSLAFSPDGKWVAVTNQNYRPPVIHLVDLGSGKEAKSLPAGWELGRGARIMAFSPDSKWLAAAYDDSVELFDVGSGKSFRRLEFLKRLAGVLSFSGDGKVLVCSDHLQKQGCGVVAWDTSTGKVLGSFSLSPLSRREGWLGLNLSPNGQLLAGWSRDNGVCMWDVSSGKEVRRLTPGTGLWCFNAAFSPDGTLLAMAENAAVSVWETATGKLLYRSAARLGAGAAWTAAMRIQAPLAVLVFSPDGKMLAAADDGAVQLWEAASGKRLGFHPGVRRQPYSLAFRGDKVLALGLSGLAIWVWDVKAGKPVSLAGGHQFPIHSVAFSPDGKQVLTSASDGVLAWDAHTGKQLDHITLKGSEGRMVDFKEGIQKSLLSLDGKRWLTAGYGGYALSVANTATGDIEFDLMEEFRGNRHGKLWAVSGDGSVLAELPETNGFETVNLWNLIRGQKLLRVETKQQTTSCLALSADGSILAIASGEGIRLYDGADKERLWIRSGWQEARALAFSPDGKMLASAGWSRTTRGEAVLWDIASGRELGRFPCQMVGSNLVFAQDGRTLALSSGENPFGGPQVFCVKVYELASGTVRHEFATKGLQTALAFSPDGGTLAASAADTTMMLWDVAGRRATPAKEKMTPKQLDDLWSALDEADASKAYPAMARLVSSPEAISFLKARLHRAEVSRTDEKAVVRLIGDLDSENFRTREAASKELAKLGQPAKSLLEKALAAMPSTEQRRRIQDLLNMLVQLRPNREMLRPTRALEVLEKLATPEARSLLKDLAEGHPDAPLTQQAKEALTRLARNATKG